MGLKSAFQNAAVGAFKAAGDIVISAAYKYIFDDGFGIKFDEVQNLNIIIEKQESNKYVDSKYESIFNEKILSTDIICLTPALSCIYEIKNGAQVIVENKKYTVKGVLKDPASAIYTILLRAV